MKKTLIHIGLHKTGTTWLQNELFISKNEIFEPLSISNKAFGHSKLANEFIFDQNNYLLNSFDDNTENINKSLKSILNAKKNLDKTFVMSHERLSGYPHSSGFDSSIIARRIKKIFPNGKILIVIREQVSCIFSNYFQYLKEGGTLCLTKYLNMKYDGRKPGFSPNYFKYHHLIESYQTKFGKQNVLVLPYELFLSDKIQFFIRLSDFLDDKIAIKQAKFNEEHNTKSNHYLNYKLRFLNNYIKSTSSLNGASPLKLHTIKVLALKIKLLFNKLPTEKLDVSIKNKFKKEIEKWSEGRFSDSNRRTCNLIDFNLEDFGYVTSIDIA